MSILKTILKHNPIDSYSRWNRKRLTRKGKVEQRDYEIYWGFGVKYVPLILKITNNLTVEGTEHIPELLKHGHKGFIVVANHQYALDPFFIGAKLNHENRDVRTVYWVSKYTNSVYPIQRSLIEPFGTIYLSPDHTLSEEAKEQIRDALDLKCGIGMFPEGHRSKDGVLRPFHSGAARFCLEHNVPYLPVCITGNRMFFKGKCHVRIGKPVFLDPKLAIDYENCKDIAADMHDQVAALLAGAPTDQLPICRYDIDEAPTRMTRKVTSSVSEII